MTREKTERRLRSGTHHRLGEVSDLFMAEKIAVRGGAGRTRRIYRQTDQEMIEPFGVALARMVTAMLEQVEAEPRIAAEPTTQPVGDQVTLLDLSGLEDADPAALAAGIRSGIRAARPEGDAWGGPLWTAGRRFAALRWQCDSRRGTLLRASFRTFWELEDGRHPGERVPLPLLTEEGAGVLGDLPPRMCQRRSKSDPPLTNEI